MDRLSERPLQVLCFGDSNTWGYVPLTVDRYPESVRWTGVMAQALGAGFRIIEEGQNGRTTVWDDPLEGGNKNGLRYLPACLESHHPLDLVIIMLGTNDLKARWNLCALDIALGVETLVKLVQQSSFGPDRKAPGVLVAVPPIIDPQGDCADMFAGGAKTAAGFSRRFREMAERCQIPLLDVGELISVDPSDGIHYSAAAHRTLGLAMADKVRSLFSSQESDCQGARV